MKWICLLGLMLAAAGSARAFVSYINPSGNVLRWNLVSPPAFVHTNVVNRATKAVRYFISAEAYSTSNRVAELNAVRACFAQWQSVPGTILKFEEGGLIGAGVDIDTADNTNVVFWAKNSTIVNNGWDDIRGLRGYTVTAFASDNTILEADTVLNGVQFAWRTDFEKTDGESPFIEATLLHEIGHFIGLDHSPVGGATVTKEGGPGLSTEAGLSTDDIAAVRTLYPGPGILATLGTVRGTVTRNGAPVFGAVVVAENAAGNVVAGTVSRSNGAYELPALQPGPYQVRVCPLDPNNADERDSLLRGSDIAIDYDTAVTDFLPTTNRPATVSAGTATRLDFSVVPQKPAFRIAAISRPIDHPAIDTADRYASALMAGQSNWFVGVVSRTLPTNNATLLVTGDGITLGQTTFKPNRFVGGYHVISVPISVASNATPGLRSLVVQQGTNLAYANGYIEILPPVRDDNFDGLNDRFQRRYFPLFTAPEAAPDADPDDDGFDNQHEYETGSNPADPRSLRFQIQSVTVNRDGSLVQWESARGKQYQLFSRPDLPGSDWQPVGLPIAARGSTTEYLDRSATNAIRFYRVQQLP